MTVIDVLESTISPLLLITNLTWSSKYLYCSIKCNYFELACLTIKYARLPFQQPWRLSPPAAALISIISALNMWSVRLAFVIDCVDLIFLMIFTRRVTWSLFYSICGRIFSRLSGDYRASFKRSRSLKVSSSRH